MVFLDKYSEIFPSIYDQEVYLIFHLPKHFSDIVNRYILLEKVMPELTFRIMQCLCLKEIRRKARKR
jgi:hypothetical protein